MFGKAEKAIKMMLYSAFFSRAQTIAAFALAAGAILSGGAAGFAQANETAARGAADKPVATAPAVGPSGLPLPRFVTLKSGRVNMRVGPDMGKYPVIWSYRQRGLPVEIVQEYDNWRRIRDKDGAIGWVNAALLSGKRAAIIETPKKAAGGLAPLYAEPSEKSRVVMKAEPGVIGEIKQCGGLWCELIIENNRGYIRQDALWGVYAGEIIR